LRPALVSERTPTGLFTRSRVAPQRGGVSSDAHGTPYGVVSFRVPGEITALETPAFEAREERKVAR
jgi:hypothetical protein